MDAFVLDMRNNPGGLLGSAIDVCGEFVKKGQTKCENCGHDFAAAAAAPQPEAG